MSRPSPRSFAPSCTTGIEVVWYGSRLFESRITATGASFRPILSTLDYGDSDYNRYFPERVRYSGLAQIKFDFKHAFVDAVPGYVKDRQVILDEFPADVVIGDPAVAATSVVAERRHLPWATVNISVLGLPSDDVAPFGLALLPNASPFGKVRNRALYWIADNVVFRDVNQHFRAVARAEGFPSCPFRPRVSPYLSLQPTTPSFEYPAPTCRRACTSSGRSCPTHCSASRRRRGGVRSPSRACP